MQSLAKTVAKQHCCMSVMTGMENFVLVCIASMRECKIDFYGVCLAGNNQFSQYVCFCIRFPVRLPVMGCNLYYRT